MAKNENPRKLVYNSEELKSFSVRRGEYRLPPDVYERIEALGIYNKQRGCRGGKRVQRMRRRQERENGIKDNTKRVEEKENGVGNETDMRREEIREGERKFGALLNTYKDREKDRRSYRYIHDGVRQD